MSHVNSWDIMEIIMLDETHLPVIKKLKARPLPGFFIIHEASW